MTTESDTQNDRVERFLEQRRDADARRVNPLASCLPPDMRAQLLKSAELGATNRATPPWLLGVKK